MKSLLTAFLLAVPLFINSQAQAMDLKYAKQLGQAEVKGSVFLENKLGVVVELEPMLAQVSIEPLNVFANPIRAFSEYRLRIKDAYQNEFHFRVPESLVTNEGTFEVPSDISGQKANTQFNQKSVLVRSSERMGSESCTYFGFCHECRMQLDGKTECKYENQTCNGSLDARYRDDVFNVNYEVLLSSARGTAQIHTAPTEMTKTTRLAITRSCH